jgi:hypothetical protein
MRSHPLNSRKGGDGDEAMLALSRSQAGEPPALLWRSLVGVGGDLMRL